MIKKDLLVGFLLEKDFSRYFCPSCETGRLCVVDGSFTSKQSAKSISLISEGIWEPTEADLVFSSMLMCDNARCCETVACIGAGCIREECLDYFPDQDRVFVQYYKPKYFFPPLNIINIPDLCHEEIDRALKNSFAVAFSSPSSALNSLRIAIEELLTYLKVRRFVNKNGKRVRVSLHDRIGMLPKQYHSVKDHLMAIKWLGNSGSHMRGNASFNDLFIAYQILEVVLEEVFCSKKKGLSNQVKKINKNKGHA